MTLFIQPEQRPGYHPQLPNIAAVVFAPEYTTYNIYNLIHNCNIQHHILLLDIMT